MRRLALLAAGLLFLAMLAGCGYTFTGMAKSGSAEVASRLAPDLRTMILLRVDNPTTESWLEPRLRSLIRDEFTRRRLVVWTDKVHAASQLVIIVKNYQRSTSISGTAEQTVKLTASMEFVVRVLRSSDGSVLWDSGTLTQDESYYPGDADDADQTLTDLAVRRIADLMSEKY